MLDLNSPLGKFLVKKVANGIKENGYTKVIIEFGEQIKVTPLFDDEEIIKTERRQLLEDHFETSLNNSFKVNL